MSQGLSRTKSFMAGIILARFDVTAIPLTSLRSLINRTALILQKSFPGQPLCWRLEYLIPVPFLGLEEATGDVSALLALPDFFAS